MSFVLHLDEGGEVEMPIAQVARHDVAGGRDGFEAGRVIVGQFSALFVFDEPGPIGNVHEIAHAAS